MKLRIVLTHIYAWPEVRRGGERYLHELGAALLRAGHEVSILTTTPRRDRRTELGVPVLSVRRRRLPLRRAGDLADELAFAPQALVRLAWRPIDVWHALGTSDAAMATIVSRARRMRSVYTDLGVPSKEYRDTRPDRRLHRLVVRKVDAYVCLSAFAADALEHDYGRSAERVGGGVDLARFQPAAARHPTPVLLYSGTLDEPRKRLRLLVEAVSQLRTEMPDLALWVTGPGDLGRVLDGAPPAGVAAVKAFELDGPGDQAALYGRAWATVLPSRQEAFGMSLLESLACGTPIVAARDGGGPADLVNPAVGSTCQPTAESLAESCRAALELARDPLAVESCRAAAAPFDWSTAIVPAMEEIYGAGR